jgi:hypothetical protein
MNWRCRCLLRRYRQRIAIDGMESHAIARDHVRRLLALAEQQSGWILLIEADELACGEPFPVNREKNRVFPRNAR